MQEGEIITVHRPDCFQPGPVCQCVCRTGYRFDIPNDQIREHRPYRRDKCADVGRDLFCTPLASLIAVIKVSPVIRLIECDDVERTAGIFDTLYGRHALFTGEALNEQTAFITAGIERTQLDSQCKSSLTDGLHSLAQFGEFAVARRPAAAQL